MTQAQENFKKAIAYRKKTGCSLKEAFAHVKGGEDLVIKQRKNMNLSKFLPSGKLKNYEVLLKFGGNKIDKVVNIQAVTNEDARQIAKKKYDVYEATILKRINGLDKVVKKGNVTSVIYSKKAPLKKKVVAKKKIVKQVSLLGVNDATINGIDKTIFDDYLKTKQLIINIQKSIINTPILGEKYGYNKSQIKTALNKLLKYKKETEQHLSELKKLL